MNYTGDSINILMVDDRPENLLALEAIIESDDYRLVKAASGEEALKCLLKYEFALILLDVQMPGIDGFGTAKIIKARERTKNIPVIFITANSLDSEHMFSGYSVGAVDYILKPFDPFILKAKVERYVEMHGLNRKLALQAEALAEKTRELEKANAELSRTTSELRISEALANVISETSIDSMIILGDDGRILKVNPAVHKMFRYEDTAVLGQSLSMLFSESSRKLIGDLLKAMTIADHVAGNDNLLEVTAVRKDGTVFFAEMQVGKRYVRDKCIVACTIRDVDKKKHYQEMITHMAYHDGLTDLPNRRQFNDSVVALLSRAKQRNQPLTMMYLDMDRFKYINDSLGHIVGDRLLREIAARLSECARQGDFVSRVGGDEFNIILPDTTREDALEMADKVGEAFKKPFYIDKFELYITASIGVSVFPYDGEDPELLMKNADAALYRAKELGRNRYQVFHSGMNMQSYRTFIMQNDLRKAVERRELELVYQPRIEIRSGEIACAEAVLLWNHPNWGRISSSEFLPLAEESGLSVEIGEWVLKTLSKQSKAWQEAGVPPIRIAVHFTAQQCIRKNLTESIRGILAEYGVSPSGLEIGVSESVIKDNELTMQRTLNGLKELGVNLRIDHYGSGNTALHDLRRYPFQSLKLDKSFIRELSADPTGIPAMLSAIVTMANSYQMIVIAEGIETEEQLAVLRKCGCQEIQGYLFSPPIPPKEFEAFLMKSSAAVPELAAAKEEPAAELVFATPENQKQEILNAALYRTKEKYAISSREMEVFALIVDGLSNKEISDKLFISEHTVKNHITHILQKLNVNDRLQAMAKVYQACIDEGKKLYEQ